MMSEIYSFSTGKDSSSQKIAITSEIIDKALANRHGGDKRECFEDGILEKFPSSCRGEGSPPMKRPNSEAKIQIRPQSNHPTC